MVNPVGAKDTATGRRVAATRASLLRAGVDLLADRPIDAIAIDDIVAAAGVAKGSFFNHFEDKHAFAGAIAAQIRGEIEQRVMLANTGVAGPAERMARAMLVFAAFALEEPRRAAIMVRGHEWATHPDHPLNEGLRADIDAGVRAGLYPTQAQEAGAVLVAGACHALLVSLLERQRRRTEAVAHATRVIRLVLCGLGVDRGEATKTAQRAATTVFGSRVRASGAPGAPR
jgi:AcrR family transcriptional regulator